MPRAPKKPPQHRPLSKAELVKLGFSPKSSRYVESWRKRIRPEHTISKRQHQKAIGVGSYQTGPKSVKKRAAAAAAAAHKKLKAWTGVSDYAPIYDEFTQAKPGTLDGDKTRRAATQLLFDGVPERYWDELRKLLGSK